MNDQESNETYAALVSILRENSLDWVVSQVEEQLRLGKFEMREIESLKEVPHEDFEYVMTEGHSGEFKKGPKITVPVALPYRPSERLLLLIDAIEQAVVNTAEMGNHLSEYFEAQIPNFVDVTFYSEDLERASTTMSRQTFSSRASSTANLRELLDSTRAEIAR